MAATTVNGLSFVIAKAKYRRPQNSSTLSARIVQFELSAEVQVKRLRGKVFFSFLFF